MVNPFGQNIPFPITTRRSDPSISARSIFGFDPITKVDNKIQSVINEKAFSSTFFEKKAYPNPYKRLMLCLDVQQLLGALTDD